MRRGVLTDLPFPSGCASCGAPGTLWCSRCERSVVVLAVPPLCARCGRPAAEPLARCADCPPAPVDSLRAPFVFQGPVRDALLALKFAGRRDLARPLGRAMAAAHGSSRPGSPETIVTWVPLSGRRLAERGYDQAEALGRSAAAVLGAPIVRLLERVADTPPQARRNRAERRGALRGAFRTVGPVIAGEVILIDDVVTTGSTVAECASVLGRAGAARVRVLAAARTLSGALPARCYAAGTVPTGSVVARG